MAVLLRTADLEFRAPASAARESGFALRPPHADQPVLLPATGIHPAAVALPLAAAAWFVEVAWCAFGGGETSPVLAVVTFYCLIFFGLFVGGAALGCDMTPGRAHHRSFQAFLDGRGRDRDRPHHRRRSPLADGRHAGRTRHRLHGHRPDRRVGVK